MKLGPKQRQQVLDSFLFAGVEPAGLTSFLEELEVTAYPKGSPVYTAHTFRRAIGVILSGTAVVRKGENLVLNLLRAGDCFGVAALFSPVEQYVTTIEAKTDLKLVFISGQQLEKLFYENPQIAVNYIAFLSQRINFLNRKIDSFTAPCAQAGLALYLLERMGEDKKVPVSGGYTQLAKQLGIGRASLYRCLERLEKARIIARGEGEITVTDPDALRQNSPIL